MHMAAAGTLLSERLNELTERVWRLDRFHLEAPDELWKLAELFPDGSSAGVGAVAPIDLGALNTLLRPRGFLATWDDGSLLFFRVHL